MPKTSEHEAWCAWHEHWTQKDVCPHCGTSYPGCYTAMHLRYACASYFGVMAEPVKVVKVVSA